MQNFQQVLFEKKTMLRVKNIELQKGTSFHGEWFCGLY